MKNDIQKIALRSYLKGAKALDRLNGHGFEALQKHYPELVTKHFKKTVKGYSRNGVTFTSKGRQLA